MQVKDSPDAIVCADVNDTIQFLECTLFQLAGLHVILKVVIIERKTYAIQSQGLEEFSICIREEIFKKLLRNCYFKCSA